MIAERIGFLGGGKIAQAMAKGFIASGLTKGQNLFASCHPKDTASYEAFKAIGAQSFIENSPVVKQCEVLFVSVKPNVISEVLQDVRPLSANKLFISIAMGVTLATLQGKLESSAKIVRVMPNTAVTVQNGCAVFARSKNATDGDASLVQTLFNSIGTCEEVPEKYFDAVTALSGSGPAYVYVMIEALADGGVKMGLPRDLAYRLASQTVMGAGKMVKETGVHPAQLKDEVASPAGSTIHALHYLERKGFRESLIGAIEQATLRCGEVAKNG